MEENSSIFTGSIDTNTQNVTINATGSVALATIFDSALSSTRIAELSIAKDPSLYTQTDLVMGLPLNAGNSSPNDDITSNGNDATLQGGAAIDGKVLSIEQVSGPAEADYNTFGFDSTSKYVNVPSFNIPAGSCSIVAWVKTGAGSSGQDRIFRLESPELHLTIQSNGKSAAVYNSSVVLGPTVVRDGNWHLFGLSFDGSNVSIWLDGQQDASTSATATSFSDTLFIGRNHLDEAHFTGSMTTFMVFTKSLSSAEWAALYQSGKATYYETLPSSLTSGCVLALEMSSRDSSLNDLSGNNNNGTANGGVTDDGDLQTFTSYT